jgi:hypothetical protein
MTTSRFDQLIKARLTKAGLNSKKTAFPKLLTDAICTRCKVTETLLALTDQEVFDICKPQHKEPTR